MRKKSRKNIRLDLYKKLREELHNPDSIGEIFSEGDPNDWKSDYHFWKNLAEQVGFNDKTGIKLTKGKIPDADWFEHLLGMLREGIPENSEIKEVFNDFEQVPELDRKLTNQHAEEELRNFREKLRVEFNSDTGNDLSSEEFENLLDKCEVLFSPPEAVPNLSGLSTPQKPQIENQSINEIAELLKKARQGRSDEQKSGNKEDADKKPEPLSETAFNLSL